MHSIDAKRRSPRPLCYGLPREGPEGEEADPEALSRARARFMGGGLDQAS